MLMAAPSNTTEPPMSPEPQIASPAKYLAMIEWALGNLPTIPSAPSARTSAKWLAAATPAPTAPRKPAACPN
jgi:hypothetical protein